MKNNGGMIVHFYEDKEMARKNGRLLPSIFLAGPMERGCRIEDGWQGEALNLLRARGFDGCVYVPSSKNGIYEDGSIPFEDTTKWEWERLGTCDAILFWVPRDNDRLMGYTTNVEFGRYVSMRPTHVILGYPEWAIRMEYLEMLYRAECNRASYDRMDRAVEAAIELAYQKNHHASTRR